jgi:hypothetical protein
MAQRNERPEDCENYTNSRIFWGVDPQVMARKRSGIKIKKSHQGRLRRKAGTKKGKKIPVSKLRSMKKSKSAATRRQATFALNARRWNRGRR